MRTGQRNWFLDWIRTERKSEYLTAKEFRVLLAIHREGISNFKKAKYLKKFTEAYVKDGAPFKDLHTLIVRDYYITSYSLQRPQYYTVKDIQFLINLFTQPIADVPLELQKFCEKIENTPIDDASMSLKFRGLEASRLQKQYKEVCKILRRKSKPFSQDEIHLLSLFQERIYNFLLQNSTYYLPHYAPPKDIINLMERLAHMIPIYEFIVSHLSHMLAGYRSKKGSELVSLFQNDEKNYPQYIKDKYNEIQTSK